MENNFCVFIISHKRSDNVITYNTLKNANYTGAIYIIVDNEDPTINQYQSKFGNNNVIIFDKKRIADLTDEGNNFDNRKTTTHARNACFEIAENLGYKYFLVLDDDYTAFDYRLVINSEAVVKPIKNLDRFFKLIFDYYISNNFTSIALSQGGDFIGGLDNGKSTYRFNKRKCMNTFFCSTDRKFQFVGQLNEDVNTYVILGSRGNLFFTIPFASITQKQTQKQKGGMTDAYIKYGTYCKSFTTILYHPSSVKVSMMNAKNIRLHHKIKWVNTTPMIINKKYKK